MSTLLNKIRSMVLSGQLAPGERLTEMGLSRILGVSRTPIRNALLILETEGFLEVKGKRGYSVKQFSAEECVEALELRAALEGIAARKLAHRGVSQQTLSILNECLEQGDRLLDNQNLTDEDCDRFGEINLRFHQTIVQSGGSDILQSFVNRLNNVPFISPAAIVFEKNAPMYPLLYKAHGQHHDIVEAIREGDGSRAETLFREHAHGQKTSMFASTLKETRHSTKTRVSALEKMLLMGQD